jgi:hypothetical protein
MSAVPALRKVREERGSLDRGKTNKLKVRRPAKLFAVFEE